MAIINIGNINKKILFALIGGGFKLLVNIILYHSEVKMNTHPSILGLNAGLGLSLSFFPYLYLKLKRNNNNNQHSQVLKEEFLIYNNEYLSSDKETKKFVLLYFLVSLLDFSQKFLGFFYVKLYLENFWIFDSFFLLIFSFLILKTKIYKHHFVSIIMMTTLGIILIIIQYHNKEVTILHIFITLFTEILASLEFVFCKCVVNIKFCSPYHACFFAGIFEIIIHSILLIIFSNVPMTGTPHMNKLNNEYIDNFSMYIDKLDTKEVLIFILSMLGRLSFILFSFIILDYFTPSHVVLIFIIGEISFIFLDDYDWKIYLKIVFFLLLLFFILIFLEIIEINLFGLDKNTAKNISHRAREENDDIYYDRNNTMSSYGDEINELPLIDSNVTNN